MKPQHPLGVGSLCLSGVWEGSKLEWRRTLRWWVRYGRSLSVRVCSPSCKRARTCPDAQTPARVGERPAGLFADQIRRRAPSHNEGGLTSNLPTTRGRPPAPAWRARGFVPSATLTHSYICLGYHLYSFPLNL